MKLATYQDGSLDGQLVVVSRDLSCAHYATHICHTMQQLLDDWSFLSPQLQDLYEHLNRPTSQQQHARHSFPFERVRCMAPLPRVYQWVSAKTIQGSPLTVQAGGTAAQITQALSADQLYAFYTETLPIHATQTQLREALRLCVPLLDVMLAPRFDAVAQTLDEFHETRPHARD